MASRGTRHCLDCGARFPEGGQPGEPWIDVTICPACSSDETVGEVLESVSELALLTGETDRVQAATGEGRR